MVETLYLIFKSLLLVTGIVVLIILLASFIMIPFEKAKKEKKANEFADNIINTFEEVVQQAIDEIKKEEETKKQEKTKRKYTKKEKNDEN